MLGYIFFTKLHAGVVSVNYKQAVSKLNHLLQTIYIK